jgi:hypothetical protein
VELQSLIRASSLIDHVTSIRLRLDPNHFGMTVDAESHDEILLKDSDFTCSRELKGDTFADR